MVPVLSLYLLVLSRLILRQVSTYLRIINEPSRKRKEDEGGLNAGKINDPRRKENEQQRMVGRETKTTTVTGVAIVFVLVLVLVHHTENLLHCLPRVEEVVQGHHQLDPGHGLRRNAIIQNVSEKGRETGGDGI
jgi:hypothetical protein